MLINRNDNGQDVYAHYSAIVNKNPNHRVRSLADGELVQFNIVEGSKGAEACDITGLDGAPVQGSEYARPKTQTRSNSENRTQSFDYSNKQLRKHLDNASLSPTYEPRSKNIQNPASVPFKSSTKQQQGNFKRAGRYQASDISSVNARQQGHPTSQSYATDQASQFEENSYSFRSSMSLN